MIPIIIIPTEQHPSYSAGTTHWGDIGHDPDCNCDACQYDREERKQILDLGRKTNSKRRPASHKSR